MNNYKQKLAELEIRLDILRDKKRKVYSINEMREIEKVVPANAQKTWNDDLKQNYVEYTEGGAKKQIWIEDIESLKEKISLITENDLVNIGDIINIKILNDDFTETIKLVMNIEGNTDYLEVELSSPLGSAIINQKVGSIINYTVNDELLEVLIINKELSKKKVLN